MGGFFVRTTVVLLLACVVNCDAQIAEPDSLPLPPDITAILKQPAPDIPTCPAEVEQELQEMRNEIAPIRDAFLRGDRDDLDEAIARAQAILEARLVHQSEWTDANGALLGEWWQVSDARRLLDELLREAALPRTKCAELARIDELKRAHDRIWDEGRFASALQPLMKQRAQMNELGHDSESRTLTMLKDFAYSFQQIRDYPKAIQAFDDALALHQQVLGDEHPDTIELHNGYGFFLQSIGRYAAAESHFVIAYRNNRRLGPDVSLSLTFLNNTGFARSQMARSEDALAIYQFVLSERVRVFGAADPQTLLVRGEYAYQLHHSGFLREAETQFQTTLQAYRDQVGADDGHTLRVAGNFAALLQDLGRVGQAESLFRDALLRTREQFGDLHPATLKCTNNLAYCLRAQGRFEEATPYFQEVLEGARETFPPQHPRTLLTLSNMGYLLQARGHHDEAKAHFEEAYEGLSRVRGPTHPQTLLPLQALARLDVAEGRFDEAEERFLKILNARRTATSGEHPTICYALNDLGDLTRRLGRFDESHRWYDQSLQICDSNALEFDRRRLDSLVGKARTHTTQGNSTEAEALLTEALAIAETVRLETTGDERSRAAFAGQLHLKGIASELAIRMIRDGRFEEALSMSERGRGRAMLDLIATSDVETIASLGAEDRTRLTSLQQEETAAEEKLRTAEAALASLRASPNRSRDDDVINAQLDLVRRLNTHLAESTASVRAVFNDIVPAGRPMTGSEIIAGLQPEDVLLSYVFTQDSAGLIVVTRGDQAVARVEGFVICDSELQYHELVALAQSLSRGLTSAGSPGVHDVASSLIDQLVPASVRDGIMRASRLIIVPDGPLTTLPLGAALAIADDAELMPVSYADSGTMYVNRLEHANDSVALTDKIVLLGDPVFRVASSDGARLGEGSVVDELAEASLLEVIRLHGGVLSPLAGTRDEVNRVGTVWTQSGREVTTLLGADATLQNLESQIDDAALIHLATHGLVGSRARPYDASLALTHPDRATSEDIGFLTLERIMRTWSGRLDTCDLVILSACDTQRGIQKGDSLMALPWGFFYAGAPTVMASLWRVDDIATSLLMSRVHENLLGAYNEPRLIELPTGSDRALSKVDALREAKTWLRNLTWEDREVLLEGADQAFASRGVTRATQPRESFSRPYEHPYYWAPFVLIGAPD